MNNPVVLVTGASSGIGKVTSLYLMEKGFHVYGTSRKAEGRFDEEHTSVNTKSGGFVHMLPLDVTDCTSMEIAVSTVYSKEGKIDVLVCNAGIGVAGSIEDTPIETAKLQFETNFFGTLRTVKAVLPLMRKQQAGKIIVLSSVAGFLSIPYQAHYSASKFALEGLIEALRYEIAPFGLKACLVEPGDTKTGFTDNRTSVDYASKESPYHDRFIHSLARMEKDERNGVSPEAVAKVIYRLIRKKNPPLRVAVGFQYKAIRLLKRVMPARAVEKIVGMIYNS